MRIYVFLVILINLIACLALRVPIHRRRFPLGSSKKVVALADGAGGGPQELDRCSQYIRDCRNRGPDRWGGSLFGGFVRYLNQVAVGLLFGVLMRVFNSVKVNNIERLLKQVETPREDGRPLLSISNHQSMIDDPGLWSGILPWWRIHPDKVRWSVCTEGVFFAIGWLTKFMGAGNVLPLDRSGSLNQPAFEYFWEKLNSGEWCHIFPEGRIWQDWRFDAGEPHMGPFKAGVGKIIAHCKAGREPIIVPMYHRGMDQIIPEKVLTKKPGSKRAKASKPRVKFPQIGKKVEVWFGEPFDVKETVQRFRSSRKDIQALDSWDVSSSDALALYQEIANEIRERMLDLEATALGKESRRDGPPTQEIDPPKLATA